jgi:hypothetical protein
VKPFKPKKHGKARPEAKIQDEIIKYLNLLGWYVKATHGNAYTSGWPDLYACHKTYGARWIEVKLPNMKGSKYTPAQLDDFPLFCAHGSGVWVMTAATEEEYRKILENPPNWWKYTSVYRT